MTQLSDLILIGISGAAGSGKDTIADYIAETYATVYAESFAGPLKRAASEAFGIPLHHFHEPAHKEVPNPYWNVSPRQIAQFVGTEMFRDVLWKLLPEIQSNFWIKRLEGYLTGNLNRPGYDPEYEAGDVIIIPDVRFQNEYNWLVRNGGKLIQLYREGATGEVGIPNHPSEQGIVVDPFNTYTIHNNDTIEVLHEKVEHALEFFNLKLVPLSFDVFKF